MEKPRKHKLPDDIYKVMLDCWEESPIKRPTFESLMNYFENYGVSSEKQYTETEGNGKMSLKQNKVKSNKYNK